MHSCMKSSRTWRLAEGGMASVANVNVEKWTVSQHCRCIFVSSVGKADGTCRMKWLGLAEAPAVFLRSSDHMHKTHDRFDQHRPSHRRCSCRCQCRPDARVATIVIFKPSEWIFAPAGVMLVSLVKGGVFDSSKKHGRRFGNVSM